MKTTLDRLYALRGVSRELWIIYVLKVLESFAYFSASLNLALHLTSAFGFSDFEAGVMYSAWGVITGVIGFATGPLIDRLGVRNSLLVGGSLLTLGRVVFAGATTRSQLYLSLFVLQPLGMTLGIPVLAIGIRRVTTRETMSTAYGIFYSVMNCAALISGLGTDVLRAALKEDHALQWIFWIGAGVSALYTMIAFLWFRPVPAPESTLGEPVVGWRRAWLDAKETSRDPVFWRLVAFSGVIFGARSIFRHMDATLPRWMEREIGPHAKYGTVYSINPAIIIIAVPVLQARLADADPYRCITVGTLLTTLAPFTLALMHASYGAAIVFMLFLSAGEAIYAPLLYSYAMALSPPGKEGLYSTLAAAPLFLVKIIAGAGGGALLGEYCPIMKPRRCQIMWFIIGAIAATTPVGLFVLKRYLYTADVKKRIKHGHQQGDMTTEDVE